LQTLLNYHTTACELTGGTLTIGQNAVVAANLDGDATPDDMLDSSALSCSTAPAMFCGEGIGCELNIFVGDAQHSLVILD
jgi:hypothetical protein